MTVNNDNVNKKFRYEDSYHPATFQEIFKVCFFLVLILKHEPKHVFKNKKIHGSSLTYILFPVNESTRVIKAYI